MKNLFVALLVVLAVVGARAEDEAQPDIVPPVLNGHMATVERLDLVVFEVFPVQGGVEKQPFHSKLMATVVYSSVCQTAASFVVMKNAEPFSYSVIEAHAPIPKGRVNCQAMNRVEFKVPVTDFYGSQPRIDQIRVNGVILK